MLWNQEAKTRAFPPNQDFPLRKAVPLCVWGWVVGVGRGSESGEECVKREDAKARGKQNQGNQQEINPCTCFFSPLGFQWQLHFFCFEMQQKLLPWLGVWGGVYINAHKSISDSLEPPSKEWKAHIYLTTFTTSILWFYLWSRKLSRSPNPNPSELGVNWQHPCRGLLQASISQVLCCQDPESKMDESKLLFIVW